MSSEPQTEPHAKPKIAVFKFASCDGCQLSLLDAEDELLAVAGAVDIAYFPEASRAMLKGPYDIGLVEGSITTHHDAERIQQVRRQCKTLVTIGACATAGGIQALRNWKDVDEFIRVVYATPQFISTLKSLHAHRRACARGFRTARMPHQQVPVDRVDHRHAGRTQAEHPHLQCVPGMQAQGNVCMAVAHGTACLGPVTQAGCGALCPAYRPRLLRLLRADGKPNTASLDRPVPGSRADRRADFARVPRIQRLGLAVPQSQRGVRTQMTDAHQRRSMSKRWPAWKAKARSTSS